MSSTSEEDDDEWENLREECFWGSEEIIDVVAVVDCAGWVIEEGTDECCDSDVGLIPEYGCGSNGSVRVCQNVPLNDGSGV